MNVNYMYSGNNKTQMKRRQEKFNPTVNNKISDQRQKNNNNSIHKTREINTTV